MIILLLNGYVGDDTFYFAGNSSKEYLFKWDKALTAYTFRPTCQEDADDIFKQCGPMWQLSALCDGAANDATPAGAPTVKSALPARYYRDLDTDELVEMARSPDVGLMDAKESDGKPLLLRLIGAYFQGAGLLRENPVAAEAKIKAVATPPAPPAPPEITTSATVSVPATTGFLATAAPVTATVTLNGDPIPVKVTPATSDDLAPIKRRRAKKPELAHA